MKHQGIKHYHKILGGSFSNLVALRYLLLVFLVLQASLAHAQLPEYLSPSERVWLQEHPGVRLGIDPAWLPFEYFDDNGQYQGLASSYIDYISGQLRLQMKPETDLSWAEVIQQAKAGELDVLPCVVSTPQRREFLTFTEPYLDFPMVIMSRNETGFISGIRSILDETVGVVEGYASYDLLSKEFPDLKFQTYKTLEDGLNQLALGRIDYFVDNLASISHVLKSKGLTNLKFAAQTPYSFKLAIGVRKDWPELVGILNKVLENMPQEVHDELQGEWITIRFEHGLDTRTVLLSLAVVAVLLILVYTFFYSRSRILESRLHEREKDNLIGAIAQVLDPKSGDEFFHTLIKQLADSLNADIAFIGRFRNQENQIEAFAVYADGKKQDAFIYDLTHTPCHATMKESSCTVSHQVQQEYPEDTMLVDMGIDGYAGVRLNDMNGQSLGIMVVLTRDAIVDIDLTEKLLRIFAVRAESELERQQSADALRKLSLAVQYSPSAVVITDVKGVVEYVNPRYSEITGYSSDDVLGSIHLTLRPGPENAKQQMNIMYNLHAGKLWQGEMHNFRKDGSSYWATEHFAPILDDKGVVTHFVAMQQDITEAHEASRKISYQATHDGLTGLINRVEFENRLTAAIQSAVHDSQEHALCFMDLDQFKVVNDTSGHVAGDELLRQIGGLLREHLRETDTLARLGGDEFAVLIENCPLHQAKHKAEEILSIIEDFRFPWEDKIFTVGVSIGITMIDNMTTSEVDVLKYADMACYAAKDAGRNRIHVYQSTDDETLLKRSGELMWAPKIIHALEHDQFRLFVQEIKPTDLRKDYVNYEVLIRLQQEDGSLAPPGAFIPAAERYNLATRLDMWVIDHVFAWLKQHAGRCHDAMHFSVNLSGQSLGDEQVLNHIVSLLESGLVPTSKLQFEVTETMAIANLQHANSFINKLRALGCGFSLDDFGSGLSSFGYLKNLDVDTLKIDGMFVRDILDDPIDAAMVEAINNIGHVMGMKTIAEFVENEQIAVKLFEMGVDFVQGYGIGKPMPIEEIPLELDHAETE